MLLSRVQLSNLALGHLGEEDRITDPDEDRRSARTIARAWDATYLFVLARAHWTFAKRTLELTARPADAGYPIALNRTAFPLPDGFVTLVEVVDPPLDEDDDSYSIEEGPTGLELLVENSGPITIRIIRDSAAVRDPARWSALFAKAFSWTLAWQISDALAADKARKDRALNGSEAAIKQGIRMNNRMVGPQREAEGDWARARRCGLDR